MACRIGNIRALLLAAVALLPLTTNAHEMRPGYLEIRETAVDTYEVFWKVPAQGDNMRMSIYLRFDDDVSLITEPVAAFVGNTHIQRMKIKREGGLTGSTLVIDGLAASLTDVLMRLERIDGTDITHRMTPDEPSYVFEADPSAWQVAWTYMALGVEHILSGVDHLLFVLIIALSIVFVAAEIIRGRQGNPGLTARLPWIVAFSFGLLHGFGFAGALSEIGLPQSSIPLALFTFNVGVEIGQLMFIAAILLLYGLGKRFRPVPPEWAWRIPSYAIGGIAAFWVFERIAGFWT
jgi:hypothetical protein